MSLLTFIHFMFLKVYLFFGGETEREGESEKGRGKERGRERKS